ncbi:hypothetical protein F7Q92_08635 [Ideonella dechloratans]|uniref:Uncharacterized protein n=1 Tax=Ideonella dechloratans TaxID=36863 RepID=A0A643FDS0_IDEDE|nr:hypothetical protein [Ideonella dechloratans]KAB0583225.1 hypothetical protein F7Q92_08635 [Ideonella dechloratans]UFU10591.1 hypothetical protein LRM40_02460 [Ideonella dechloratans]
MSGIITASGLEADVEDLIERVWDNVMKVAKAVVDKHDELGFELISTKMNPSLEEIAFALRLINQLLEGLTPKIDDMSLARQVINAKQQIYHVEMAALAIKSESPEDYHHAIESLRRQAQH